MSSLAFHWFNKVFRTGVDNLADNYILFSMYIGSTSSSRNDQIGYNRGETVKKLVFNTNFDDTVTNSLHLADDSTDYQNTSGKTAYAIVTVNAAVNSGDRAFKIWSAPTTNSKTAAIEVYDSADWAHTSTGFDGSSDKFSSVLVPITVNHFVVIENTSGTSSRNINVSASDFPFAMVIEQAP